VPFLHATTFLDRQIEHYFEIYAETNKRIYDRCDVVCGQKFRMRDALRTTAISPSLSAVRKSGAQ
jgi:hypothetical protein